MSVGLLPPPNPAYTPGLQLLGVYTASAGASIDIVSRNQGGLTGPIFQSDFDEYEFEAINIVPATDNTDLRFRVSLDGGATFVSSNDYHWSRFGFDSGGSSVAGATNVAFIRLAAGIDNDVSFGLSGNWRFIGPLTSVKKKIYGHGHYLDNSPLIGVETGNGTYNQATVVNACQFLMSAGTITGTILVYGKAKSATVGSIVVPPVSGLNLLGTYTATAAATLPVVTRNTPGKSGAIFQSDYNQYEIIIESVVNGTAASFVKLRASTNGGATYDTGANYDSSMFYYRGAGSGIGGGIGQTMFHLSVAPPAGMSANVAGGGSAKFTIFNPLSATRYKQIHGRMIDYETANAFISYDFQGAYVSTTPMNAFQIFPDVGTFTITLYVYGWGM